MFSDDHKDQSVGTDIEVLKDFATVAEENGQIDVAEKFHLDRISKYEDEMDVW